MIVVYLIIGAAFGFAIGFLIARNQKNEIATELKVMQTKYDEAETKAQQILEETKANYQSQIADLKADADKHLRDVVAEKEKSHQEMLAAEEKRFDETLVKMTERLKILRTKC